MTILGGIDQGSEETDMAINSFGEMIQYIKVGNNP
jgi:hypothetical protein